MSFRSFVPLATLLIALLCRPSPAPSQPLSSPRPAVCDVASADLKDCLDRQTIEIAQQSLDVSIRALSAAERQSRFALWSIVGLGLTLLISAGATIAAAVSAAASKHAVDLSLREARLSNPPVLKVYKVSIWVAGPDKGAIPSFTAGERIQGDAWIFNAGQYEADIVYSHLEPWWGEILPMPSAAPHLNPVPQRPLSAKHLGNGEADHWKFDVEVPAKRGDFYIVGEVRYRDAGLENGPLRHTYFARRYNPEKKRFEAVDDVAYEGII